VLEGRGKHEITVYDPVTVFGKGGALEGDGELKAPHFFFGGGQAPPVMDAMQQTLKAADCFLIVSPEYNHTIPPALSSMMGHFGGSNFANKVSGIITYSPSPFGGMRAAVAIKIMLSELGCCPISKLAGIGTVTDVLNEDGTPKEVDGAPPRTLNQIPKLLTDLEWWADAVRIHRDTHGPPV
jgi:chromate reductase